MIRLALLRHGPTAWNREGRIQGRSDIPLDDSARADLAALRLPPPWDRAALWSSPLRRAVETHDTEAASLIADRWVEHEGKSVRDKTATEGSLGAG